MKYSKLIDKIKILHFIPSLRSGGMERQLVELILGFNQMRYFSHVLYLMSSKIHYKYILKSKVPITVIERDKKHDIKFFFRFLSSCMKVRPNIIHSWNSMCSIYALPAAKLIGAKFINGFVRDAPMNLSLLNKNKFRSFFTFPFSDAIISNSIAGLEAYKVPKNKAKCIYNGFDLARIDNIKEPDFMKASMDIRPNQKIIGMVASFFDNKNHIDFIHACQKIMKNRSDIVAILVGDGPNLKYCKSIIAPKFKHQFLFLGERIDVENIINIFDVGVLVTNTNVHGEGISNAVMEYMALSKPVVVTYCGGNAELVKDGGTGFIVKHGEVDELSDKIRYLIDHPRLASSYGAAGYNRIKENFSISRMVNSYSIFYRKLIKPNVS